MIAGSSVLEYEFISPDVDMPESNPPTAFPSTDSEENQLIRLGHNNPPAEAIIELEETIRIIAGRNERVKNRDNLLDSIKNAVKSIKERLVSNDILQKSIGALKKFYKDFIKIDDVVSRITRAIEIIDNIGKGLGFW